MIEFFSSFKAHMKKVVILHPIIVILVLQINNYLIYKLHSKIFMQN